jgi:hypothetical protein
MPVLRMRLVKVLLRQPCQPEQAANGDTRVQSLHRAASHCRGLLAVGGLQSTCGSGRPNLTEKSDSRRGPPANMETFASHEGELRA